VHESGRIPLISTRIALDQQSCHGDLARTFADAAHDAQLA
jgi:hypothetical protein